MDERRVADYFIVSGVSENTEHNAESKPVINSVLPITDITVIIKALGEQCPIGYDCIEFTPTGHVADLNNGNFKSPNLHICYRRGSDKPPLVDVGVFYQDKDRLLQDVEVVSETPYGRSANTGNSTQKGTFISFRRAKTNSPYVQPVVVDLCVILNNKSEHPPHAFYSIKKNLNNSYYGMLGSEVFLCYKKTLLSPPSLCFTPQIISRFPLQDLANFPLPDTVPLFCLPAGATIESRPANTPLPRPIVSTFVLTSDSAQKIYGSALSFYEPYDESLLTDDQKTSLRESDLFNNNNNRDESESDADDDNTREIYAMKSICILSRWPFFDCFEKFLHFLHKLVFNPLYTSSPSSPVYKSAIPLEHHISHFLLDVSFPTPQRPTVMVQLMPGTDETVTISLPSSRSQLPLTGASFTHLLSTLGVENTMNVLLFGLCEQKILLHSLNPWILTIVAEAISAMLFPFHWQCPYVPLCPLSLHGILNAPVPFIVGIDSRCFDTFTPPDDVICIDLDTRSIFLSELKKCLNIRILPKRAARVLKNSLDKAFKEWDHAKNQSPQHRAVAAEVVKQQRKLELEIQEAFVRFMATILRGFRTFLLPITRAPTVGATDPTSLFNFEGFLMSHDRNHSQFYRLITKTQMFTHYIEERSFVSDKDTSLAFFDDCEEKLTIADENFPGKPVKLFEKDDGLIQTDRSVYIPAPEQSPSVSHNNSVNGDENLVVRKLRFGPLNPALYHRHPSGENYLDKALKPERVKDQSLLEELFKEPNNSFSITRRTKQEVKVSQLTAGRSVKSPLEWSKYLVSCCYCLWFATLPSYIAYCKSSHVDNQDETVSQDQVIDQEKSTSRILRYAYSTIVRMQRLKLTTDEVCFRILTLLCGHYGQPALAVRVFFEMKKAGIKPNAVTYGYYNKAVLESRWPDHSSKPTTVLWTKIRNVIGGIAIFKWHGRMRMERRKERQNRSATSATREMLSQWATQWSYFLAPTSRVLDKDDSDDESAASNDLLRPSNDDDAEQSSFTSSVETNYFRLCHQLFVALENSNSKEDLIDHLTNSEDVAENDIALEIKLTTCGKCDDCQSVMSDEEIMERWSHNESDLNTTCVSCRAKIVPLMTIQVKDCRFTPDVPEPERDFTVQYLSPIVLRKELESVFESSGDNCPASCHFIDEHPIIFWNLLWYFKRIDMPTHLASLCLNSKSILDGRDIPNSMQRRKKVVVRPFWDNSK